MKDTKIGFRGYVRAFQFIGEHGLAKYFIFPLVLNILLFLAGLFVVNSFVDMTEDYLFAKLDTWFNDLSWLSGLKSVLYVFIVIIFRIIYFFIFAFFGGFLVLILMSPVLAYLSEKTEKILTGQEYPFSVDQLVRDMFRGIVMALRNMGIELLFMIAFFILGFVPVLNIAAPIGLFFVSAYFYGFSFFDYNNERKKMTIGESARFMRKHKGAVVVNGALFSIVLIVPLVGVFLASFVAVISTVAAAISSSELPQ